MNPDQLSALLAVSDTGAFDRAAGRLGVSTSAVSQRIRALESALGRVLVRRGSPSTVTAEGAIVLRYARQQELLAGEMSRELGGAMEPPEVVELPVAVNLDSLAAWMPALFAEATHWRDVYLRLVADHEGRTSELLREGAVMAAVAAGCEPVAGCSSEPLGSLRYLPVAAPALLERAGLAGSGQGRFPQRRADLEAVARLPVLRFDAADDLQDLALTAAGLPSGLPGPSVPGTEAHARALQAGMGWGMLTHAQLSSHPGLVPVPGLEPIDRRLFWYRWRLRSALLDRLTSAVHRAFATGSGRSGADRVRA